MQQMVRLFGHNKSIREQLRYRECCKLNVRTRCRAMEVAWYGEGHWFLQRLFSKSSRPTIYPVVFDIYRFTSAPLPSCFTIETFYLNKKYNCRP